ncbi:uncharacterized protein LOC144101915 [Amblyomma americanum]
MHDLHKQLLYPATPGSGADMAARRLHLVLLQVCYSYLSVNGKPFGKSTPDPNFAVCMFLRLLYDVCASCSGYIGLFQRKLLLAGDVEQNPGPLSAGQEKQMFDTIMTIPVIQQQQTEILDELRSIRLEQKNLEEKLTKLAEKVKSVEDNVSLVLPLKPEVERLSQSSQKLAVACAALESSHDDLENQSRRNNLIFYGIHDKATESWEQSETKIISFCAEKLKLSVDAAAIERAHRLGRYAPDKHRPLIVKFLSFKEKNRVLSNAAKLKDTDWAISEDYSAKVWQQRKKLMQFAKARGGKLKLRFNKLNLDNKTYMYNIETDDITCVNQ